MPGAPAGIGDILPRMFAAELGEAAARAIVVENRPAGNGVLAYDAVAKAPPDGYLMLMGNHAGLAMNPHLAKSLPYEPLKSFAPIILLVNGAEHSGGAPSACRPTRSRS